VFAVAGADGAVDLRDARTLLPTRRIRVGRPGPNAIAITPDGRTLAVGKPSGELDFADIRTGRPLGPPRLAHVRGVRDLTFTPDGTRLASTDGSVVYLWDIRQQRPASLFQGVTGTVTSLGISPDGKILVVADHRSNGSGSLDILRLPDLRLLRQAPAVVPRHIQFSPDGRVLFYGDDDGRVWLLDTRTWKPLGAPLSGQGSPAPFALDPNGRLLATTSTDGSTQLWDIPSGRPVGRALTGVPGRPVRAAFLAGGTELVTLHDDGRGFVWDLQPGQWARRACAIAGRPLTVQEWRAALPDLSYSPTCSTRP
jgi:WD40 repeat protein